MPHDPLRQLNTSLISPDACARILRSLPLGELLAPEGSLGGPYDVLEYRAVLELQDAAGARATFRRLQRI